MEQDKTRGKSGECKFKLIWDSISPQLKQLLLKKKNAGKDAEKKEHFYTIGGNVN